MTSNTGSDRPRVRRRWTSSRRCARRARRAPSPTSRSPARRSTHILDDARFAPSGGNRQPWRVARRRGPGVLRRRSATLMQPVWDDYIARLPLGITPFNVVDDVEPRRGRRTPPTPCSTTIDDRAGRARRSPPTCVGIALMDGDVGRVADDRRGVDLPVLLEHPAGRPRARARRRADDVPVPQPSRRPGPRSTSAARAPRSVATIVLGVPRPSHVTKLRAATGRDVRPARPLRRPDVLARR